MIHERVDRPGGPVMDQQELQQIAQLVEMNRQKMARIEEQITKLSEIRMEQLGVIAALKTLDAQQSTMVPLGGGVQLPVSAQGETVVIDIGSGVQAEKPREEAVTILEARLNEVEEVMGTLQNEFTETETVVTELASTFTEAAKALQEKPAEETTEEYPSSASTPSRRRRKRGTEFTLDD